MRNGGLLRDFVLVACMFVLLPFTIMFYVARGLRYNECDVL